MRQTLAIACLLALLSGPSWALEAAPGIDPPTPAKAWHEHARHAAGRHVARAGKKRVPKPPASKAHGEAEPPAAVPAESAGAQSAPPLPATLMNTPPVKPVIQMEHGLLTIDAPNCVLSDVLMGVATATGATLEGASPTERVTVRLGPGDARAILAALLRGTPYNYIILGSQSDPHAVTHILLSRAQAASAAAPSPVVQPPEPAPPPPPPAPVVAPRKESPFQRHERPSEQPAEASQETQPPVKKPQPNPTSPEELFRQLTSPTQK